ncbi:hypothetical protein GCM10025771_02190 [Niveibacterium umoris]|uniref:YqjK-like protein n=1 Tax=Niveibacterium umoris TaxID=1193620 RepID=A0A840BRS9_9RHOO|nr:YqjK family protein [Niveibacterium umoris]MBB4014238.1 hypothetical protein [Niveibacterium umoris]
MADTGRLAYERRRSELVARSRQQRDVLARELGAFAPSLRAADKLVAAAGWARRHGLVIVGVAAAVIAVRKPARLLDYAGKAFTAWRLYRDYRDRFDGLIERVERHAR